MSGGEQVGSKEKGTPTQARSRRPRQGAQQNRTWPTPPYGGVATSSASSNTRAGVRPRLAVRLEAVLTLTRLRIVNRAESHPVIRLGLLKTSFSSSAPETHRGRPRQFIDGQRQQPASTSGNGVEIGRGANVHLPRGQAESRRALDDVDAGGYFYQ
jgi:hypothetical protein